MRKDNHSERPRRLNIAQKKENSPRFALIKKSRPKLETALTVARICALFSGAVVAILKALHALLT